MVQKPQLKNWGLLFSLFFLVGIRYSSAQSFVHPGLSHKKSDLDRMKMMVAAGKEPWKSSFANLAQSPYASFNYVVRGSSSNTVLNQTISSEYNKIKFDGLAAYYNSLMWYITGDERYARKAVEIFNAWVNIRQFITDGTNALDAGRVIWKLLEGAEIIKCTYPGWQQSDIDKFKAMLVYPGYSTSQVPTDSIKSAHVTFYWYMYNGDPARHGNQGIFGMRGIMAMGVFLDNRTMYDRAFRYLTGQPHRADDLPYVSGPPIVSSTKASTSNQYFDEYTTISPYQQTTITDYGYDDQIQYYLDTNGQCEESSRDQSHPITGISILSTIAEMAWNQGDDLYGYLYNRILSGLEYEMHYNASLNYSYPDQPSSWEPTVGSG
ncbi:MAG: alginate lyase family protein, partial [Flavisolibacter sp.]